MSIVSPIVGPVFYDLLQHGRAFAALALLCCRLIFNRQGFVLFAIYCRSQRLALLAGKLRRQRK